MPRRVIKKIVDSILGALSAPGYEAVESEIRSFTVGEEPFGLTRWQSAGPDVDAAWQELYNNTILRIPKNQAAQLPNRTYPIAGDDGYYIANLDVFHQLHCLNMVRMALHIEDYQHNAWELEDRHVSHCVDSIRQSLMCSADISVNVWQWNEPYNTVTGYSSQAHQCRNFFKLRDWALDHAIPEMIDLTQHLTDDLEWPNKNW
ncbi:hypothetical protein BDP27DRAFT_1380483 [Rhodocollybia butyracea]|uniref:Tat pathway signal sequence n=1 Tax=Rhodocollybia butyracea TaxID=206335 RepID=A0A9P5UE35_9AGAR|nr:hypothetical protein BDP27DRAFT_1380483 [Rhodocollybia butyracea]